jgi:general secretion pathway protein K
MSKLTNMVSINKNRGVVLPTVLWITILTIVIAGNYASAVHLNTKAVENIKTATMLKYDSISGVYLALGRLLAGASNGNVKYELSVNNNNVEIEIRPEYLKTNLNTADANQLRNTFIDAGVNPEIAEILSDRVIDWRDPDHLTRLYGMEDNEYFNSGKNYGAKDKGFEDLVELLLIADIDKNMFRRISDYFTIYRQASGKLYTLASRASNLAGDKAYVIKAVVQLTYQSNKPYRILKWQYNQG